MLMSDQDKELVKNCWEGGGGPVSFSTASLHTGSRINQLCELRKVPREDLCGGSESFTE